MSLANLVNQQSKQKNLPDELVDAILGTIKVQNPPEQHTRANVKPSKLGCERQMQYILSKAKADKVSSVDPKLVLIQNVGSFLHERIQEHLSKASAQGIIWRDPKEIVEMAHEKGINTEVTPSPYADEGSFEVHCYNSDYDLSFQCDGVLGFRGKGFILEIKSEGSFKWMKRTSPEEQHIEQATCYSIGLGIEDVMFLYVNRDMLSMKAYLVHITEEQRQVVKDKIIRVKAAVADGTLLPATKVKSCQYCSYQKMCKRDGNPMVNPDERYE